MAGAAKRLVVLGGGGFVGSAVAQEALSRGLRVLCLSRSGRSDVPGDWSDRVTWGKADALQAETYRHHLRDADAVVVSIGSPPLPFVDRAYQLLMNGETNVTATRTAKEEGVKQVVLINAAMPPALTPKGYFDGKRAAEQAAREMAGPSFGATVLKPGGAQARHALRLHVIALRRRHMQPSTAPATQAGCPSPCGRSWPPRRLCCAACLAVHFLLRMPPSACAMWPPPRWMPPLTRRCEASSRCGATKSCSTTCRGPRHLERAVQFHQLVSSFSFRTVTSRQLYTSCSSSASSGVAVKPARDAASRNASSAVRFLPYAK